VADPADSVQSQAEGMRRAEPARVFAAGAKWTRGMTYPRPRELDDGRPVPALLSVTPAPWLLLVCLTVLTSTAASDEALATTAPNGSWVELIVAARHGHSSIYDPVRDRMVVFGGFGGSGNFDDAWTLSLRGTPAWTQLMPTGPLPSARNSQCAVYDPVTDRMVVFGGRDDDRMCTDVWALSLSGGPAWTELAAGGSPPTARLDHDAIYDPVRKRMLVVGGADDTSGVRVWALTFSGKTSWTTLTPVGTAPAGWLGYCAVYDPVRDRMLMLGNATRSRRNRTVQDSTVVWALSLDGAPAWTVLTPAGRKPPANYGRTAIYDTARDRVVIFGGIGQSNRDDNDVWALSLAGAPTWTALTPTGEPPGQRSFGSAIYDPVRDRMVIFAGLATHTYCDDVWGLSLGGVPGWTPLIPTALPTPGTEHSAIYDPVRDRMLVDDVRSYESPVDVWSLSLAGTPVWTAQWPVGQVPSGRPGCAVIYDPVRDRMLVYGGFNRTSRVWFNEVWALSLGGTPIWTTLTSMGTPPKWPRRCAIYDPPRDRMLVFGDSTAYHPAVWALSLAGTPTWTLLAPAGAPPASAEGCTAVYDPAGDRVLVFGGYSVYDFPKSYHGEVWALSLSRGPVWTTLKPSGTPPSGRKGHSAVYDPVRHGMLVFGGQDNYGMRNDLWILSLEGPPAWTELAPAGSLPSVRCFQSAIYDSGHNRLIIFGGAHEANPTPGAGVAVSGTGSCSDVWAFH